MNRLILIGNGFDLAHGLETGYKDFILWYMSQCANRYTANQCYFQDELIDLSPCRDEDDYDDIQESMYIHQYFETQIPRELRCVVTVRSRFFKELLINLSLKNWVDIENQYFDNLLDLGGKISTKSFNLEEVKQLNSEFKFLKTKLEEYLISVEQNHIHSVNPNLLDILNSPFELSDFDTVIDDPKALQSKLGKKFSLQERILHKAHVLNFNYTNTFETYRENLKSKYFSKIDLNHIHGQLNNSDNPIIFGFGDEHDKEYMQFEEQRMNELFDHIKSYQYLRTPNYRNLIRFLNEDTYQVHVIGHSCGLSDRTMFKEVFDHPNCKSIKIFHYQRPDGSTDFHEKVVNIGRHFSNKGMMRKLIVEFNDKNALPQN
ncbi:AbiH family protein [Sphingobacterium faecale]|uniref:Abortive infection AbiH-like protein n=1 Tax=Sphingobacterium faecale TaxID=2803775 RepID=A0ABS1RB69_9SPHI|nr:AbiH family protein [Sphingobacterium faecale]MBL1411086.1 hypothetical protein [Sphingobacterium faecale]